MLVMIPLDVIQTISWCLQVCDRLKDMLSPEELNFVEQMRSLPPEKLSEMNIQRLQEITRRINAS